MSDDRSGGTVAFIGLGNMGTPMTRLLVENGFEVRAFDVSEAAVERAAGLGATGCRSAVEAAVVADIVVLMLPNSAIVGAVVDELVEGGALATGDIVVDMSSSEPLRTRALADELAKAGISLVDAPVSGGVKGAERGALTIMVGGEPGAVDRVLPALEVLGKPVRCGTVGSGHAIKALNNLLSATHLWATSEAMEAGVAFGLDPEVMLQVFNTSSGRSGSTENKWPNFVLPGGYDSGFGLALMLKDMKIARGLAEANGTPTSLAAAAVALWESAYERLPGSADHTEIARVVAADGRSRPVTAAPRPAFAHDADADR